jgi:hypothetical protein
MQVKSIDGIPRSREWAYGVKIATERSALLCYFRMSRHIELWSLHNNKLPKNPDRQLLLD